MTFFTQATYPHEYSHSHKHLLSQVVEAAEFPITIPEAKAHARVELPDDDLVIEGFIRAAVDYAEWFTERAFITQEWELLLDCFPWQERTIELPKAPLQNVTSISYRDHNGVDVILDSDSYRVYAPSGPTASAGMVILKSGQRWPSVSSEPFSVTIRFTCGYGDEDESAEFVPQAIKSALLMHVAEMYENRENTIIGPTIQEVSFGVNTLLWPFKLNKLGL